MKIAAFLLAVLLPSCAVLAQSAVDDAARAIAVDPPTDAAHPASTLAIEIPSHGSIMNGLVYRPGGAGPFPLVVLMHGLPGNEQNLDVAQALRRAGWAVMTFHYRGSFGSQGRFSIDNAMEDARVAMAYAETQEAARAWNIDPGRIVVIGHSMGGLAAARTAAADPARQATILIAPWDPSILANILRPLPLSQRNSLAQERWGNVSGGRLRGISSPQIAAQIVDHGERWRLADAASGLSTRPLLILTATRDSPASQAGALVAALDGLRASYTIEEIASDHVFNDRRIELETVILQWLSPSAPTVRRPDR